MSEQKFDINRESDIKKLFKDMVKYLPTLIVPGLMGLITIPIVTRLFPPEVYGDYVLVVTTVSIISMLVGWIGMSIVRFYPAYKRDSRLGEFYGTIIKLTGISVIALFLISMVILFLIKGHVLANLYYLMCIGLLVFVLTACFELLREFLRTKRRVSWYTGFSIWKSVTTFGFGITLITVFHYGVEGLLWGSILGTAIALPLLWRIAVERSPIRTKGISAPLISEMAKYGFPLVVGNLAAWILSLSDRYILEFYRGTHEVGVYSASYGISEKSIILIVSLFQIAAGPIAMHTWEKKGKEASQEFLSRLTRYYLIFSLPAVVGLSVLAKPVISILTAPDYHEGYKIIPLVTLSAFFLGLIQRFGIGFCYYKKTYFATLCMVASGLLNLGLNFFLIPKYGYMAAAVTTLISYIFLVVLTIIFSRRFFVWKFPFRSLVKIACASAIMGMTVYYIGDSLTSSTLLNLILGIVVGVVVYSLMLFLLREFKPSEIQALLDLKAKI